MRRYHHTQQIYPAPNTLLLKTQLSLCSAASQVGPDFPDWSRCCWCQFIKNVNSKGTGTGCVADASWEAVTPAERETAGKQPVRQLYPATKNSKLEAPEAGRQGNGSSTQLSPPSSTLCSQLQLAQLGAALRLIQVSSQRESQPPATSQILHLSCCILHHMVRALLHLSSGFRVFRGVCIWPSGSKSLNKL